MIKNPTELIAKAEDTRTLLDDIAWTDVIVPALAKERDILSKMLVDSVLGNKRINAQTKEIITVEQLAGKIYGIDYIQLLFKNILLRGEKALSELNS